MMMSQRERFFGTITAFIVGSLVLYQFAIHPQLARITELDGKIQTASTDLERADQLFNTSRSATKKLSQMAGSGLRKTDAAAESELLNSTRQWAQEAGIGGWGIKRERTERERDFNKITFRANGSGGMGQIGRFLYRLQTANMPVRVSDMTINSRKDGTDDLGVVLSISTIYLAPDERPTPRPGAAAREGAEVER